MTSILQSWPFNRFLFSMANLVSACGGPVILHDLLRPRMNHTVLLAVCILPVIFMLIGAQSLLEDQAGKTNSGWVRLGLFGSLAVLAMHGHGVFVLATATAPREDQPLVVIGLAVGIPISIGIAWASKQWLDRYGDPEEITLPPDPPEADPPE